MLPTVGRIVNYHTYGSKGGEYKAEPFAAIITKVLNDTAVSLHVFNPEGIFIKASVGQCDAESPQPGHWSWPVRA